MVHRTLGRRQIHTRIRTRRSAVQARLPGLRARWRQRAPRSHVRPRLFARRSHREHPPRRRGGRALCARRRDLYFGVHLAVSRRSCNRAARGGQTSFYEVYVAADLATCEQRDPKGLYKKARAGEIEDFTGVSAPYEAPENPEIVVDTSKETVASGVAALIKFVVTHLSSAKVPEARGS